MGKIKRPEFTDYQPGQLENGFRNGGSHCFRMRCRSVLFKGDGLSSARAGELTEMSLVSMNAWMKRFLSEDRQCVSKAKASWQAAAGKEASDLTFKRFLSALAQDISV